MVSGAVIGARALDEPVGAGGVDRPAMPDGVATAPATAPSAEQALPPLALVNDEPPPGTIGQLPLERQRELLTDLTERPGAPARRFVELGSVAQALEDAPGARRAFTEARRREPGNLGAQVGLILIPAMGRQPTRLTAAAARLQTLSAANPDSQVVSFNLGWVQIYRSRPQQARRALERTAAISDTTPLGLTATTLLDALTPPTP